ncbi:ABC transporter substrate-binding protein [Marmoricola sp. RAF53]|uniref:ABC transporter substrate-binding protein n=1 Tax=Marmoricola sp. RAF53 TaxID=3233059 RepID=UPI003F98BECB
MLRWRKTAATVAAITLGASLLAACGGAGGDGGGDGGPAHGGTLKLGTLVAPTTFEAPNLNWANESPYAQAVYDTLLRASTDNAIEPGLATAWSWDDARTALTLTLRDDVKFTDGSDLTAETVVANLTARQKGTSTSASVLAGMVSAKAADATHVVITLKAPDPAFETYLTQATGTVESAKALGGKDAATTPVGSGPYLLDPKESVPGSSYAFTRNPEYWDAGQQHYDKIVMTVYPNATAILNALQGGQLNASASPSTSIAAQAEKAGKKVHTLELNWQGLMLLDRDGTLNPALGDVRVRQAINFAFDRAGMAKAIAGGYGTPTTQVFPPGSPSYDKALDDAYPYDPAKAKKLLAEAGYADGFTLKMPNLAALGTTTPTFVKQALKDVGIKVEYVDVDISNIIGEVLAPKFAATTFLLQMDPSDWQLASFQIAPKATFNPFHTKVAEVDDLLAKLQTGTPAEAATAGKALNRYVVENAWFAPWFRPQTIFVTDAGTDATMQPGNAYPYLANIEPKA